MTKRITSADLAAMGIHTEDGNVYQVKRSGELPPTSNLNTAHIAGKQGNYPDLSGQTEDDLQRACIRFFAMKYPHLWKAKRLFHVANGGSRNRIEAAKLKAMGVVPGVCDLLLLIPRGRYGAAFFELKVGRNTLSEHQQAFIEEMKSDYYCVVIRSLEDFEREVGEYLIENGHHSWD